MPIETAHVILSQVNNYILNNYILNIIGLGSWTIQNTEGSFSYGYMQEVVGYLAFLLSAETTKLAAAHFSTINLTTKQGIIIEFVAKNPTASQANIAHAAGMKPPLLVKILDDLTQKGLLVREPSPTDRRRHQLRLTEAGEQQRTQIRACHMAGNNELLEAAGFSSEETETLLRLLHKLTKPIQHR